MPATLAPPSPFRSSGFWLAAVVAVFLAVNTVRSVISPVDFAGYFGAPLTDPRDAVWVQVYALRTGLVAAIIILLLATRQLRLTAWVALLGALLPVGDVVLAWSAGAPASTLVRHVAIGIFLLITSWRLFAFPRSKA